MRYKGKRKLFALGKLALLLGWLLLIAVTCSGAVLAATGTPRSAGEARDKNVTENELPEYKLGPGDRFLVRVWGYNELEQDVFIPPNGVATVFPVGQVKAAGLSASKLDELITTKLKKYVKQDPEVIVIPTTYVHSQVYVLGQVGSPGLYPFRGKMTVLEAVTRAGGPTLRAAIQQVRITRSGKDKPDASKTIVVDLNSVIHRGEAANDIKLHPGDIIYVPDTISAAQRDEGKPRN
jgi:protein involved in polysaccharide export with SLBB domain